MRLTTCGFRRTTRAGFVAVAFVALAIVILSAYPAGAVQPGNEHYQRTWARTDQPVASGITSRTWIWGPEGNTDVLVEPYDEAPGGERQVQYFDKSRMEINNPAGDPVSPFYVTNGLLVIELMSGNLQLGDNRFEQHQPAQVNVAGDPGDPLTYADLATLRDAPALADGSVIVQTLNGDGIVGSDESLATYAVTAALRVTEPGIDHQVASPFWEFLNSTGPVSVDGQQATERLFDPWFYATGYPVTEAYWVTVQVAGTPRLVLLQCFERRCLTYTPGNPDGFLVEAGNVGQHYYRWRYELIPGEGEPGATPTATATSTATPSPTATATTSPTEQPVTEYAFSAEWGGSYEPITPILYPTGLELVGDNLWVVDSGNDRLLQYDTHGVFVRSVGGVGKGDGQFDRPQQITSDAEGNIYVADTYNHRIQVFSPDGAFLRKWGAKGAGDGEFNLPAAVAIRDGVIYVAELANYRVQMFNLEGGYLGQFGNKGSGDGQFDGPAGLAFDPDGNVYVVDFFNHRVQKFTAAGVYLSQFGSFGPGNGNFENPQSVATDADGNIYVGDKFYGRIQKFSPEGAYLELVSSTYLTTGRPVSPADLALDGEGNLFVADNFADRVRKLTLAGEPLFEIFDSSRGRFDRLTDIAVDQTGNLLVIDHALYLPQIARYTPDGEPLNVFARERSGLGQYDYLRGIAVTPDGTRYVTDSFSNRVQSFNATWTYLRQWGAPGTGPGQFNTPTAVDVDAGGNVYVVDSGNNRVQKFSSDGTFLDLWGGVGDGDGQFNDPEGIAVSGERVYVTDYGNDRVQVFDRDGNFIGQWGNTGTAPGELDAPLGIAVNPDGNVLVVDLGNNRVQLFSPEGMPLGAFGSAGAEQGQFNIPFCIEVDDEGYVYVTDAGNDRVQVFAPAP